MGLDPCSRTELFEEVDTATWFESGSVTGMECVEEVDNATWLACATELSQLSRLKTESAIYITLCSTDAASMLDPCTGMEFVEEMDTATWMCSTDAASRLDPCIGMEVVEEVVTATWLAGAVELSKLNRMKSESDISKAGRDVSQYL
ncbi:unnamed protein product [Echinostoma caproni]|uniref:Uncharacterized protein n=1 Tax=Echinostoma caproni TaxID=27848 RepID=A0A183BC16_9TREM|nr:unnamed protein product [Echinostoma caproni]